MTSRAGVTVEFYFDFSSPYSYLASTRIEEICERHGVSLQWKPILLGPLFKKIGRMPLFQRPLEGEHARVDLRRWAEYLGVPLEFPPVFPVDGLAACRGHRFAEESGRPGAYCRRLLEACWGEGRDIGRQEELASVVSELGLDVAAFLESIKRPEVKEWLRREVAEAGRRGVFGAPTFLVGEELFHGNDRLFMLEETLARATREKDGGTHRATPFSRWFGIRCAAREPGLVECAMEVTPRHVNQRGAAHGGVVTSLLDTAMGSAVVSGIREEEWCATLELSVQFREPVRQGTITGRGRMVKRGRHAAFAEGEVVDASGRVLATGHGTWYLWPARPGL